MQYAKGKIGRVYLVKFENNENLARELKKLAAKEKIKAATMVFLGALKQGQIVAGPRKACIPPKPNTLTFKNGWEALGVGTIFTGKNGPQVHIHTSMGRKNWTLTGCVREESRIFIVIEAVVFELRGIKAAKDLDPKTGINLLRIL